MTDKLTFDIETIPMQGDLSETLKDEVSKKVDRELTKNPELAHDSEILEALKNKIMATNPYFGQVITIGLHIDSARGQGTEALVGTEEEILTRFWNMIKNHRGLFISYNGLSFDVPFIIKRSMYHGIKPSNTDFLNTRRYTKYPHFDCQEVISDWDRFRAPTLRLACEHLGIPSPKEGEVEASQVYPAYLDGRIDEIAKYCERDVVATYELYKRLDGYYV